MRAKRLSSTHEVPISTASGASSSYEKRPEFWKDIDRAKWEDWLWQEQDALRNVEQVKKVLGGEFEHGYGSDVGSDLAGRAEEWQKSGFRFLITPYVLSLVEKDRKGIPLENDPLWRQVFPLPLQDKAGLPGKDEYRAEAENWEEEAEMISPIAQQKYDNRVIVYLSDVCLGYCNYCFRSLQSGDDGERHGGKIFWKQTIEEIKKRTDVAEVILSGGDPLVLDNASIEQVLRDLREIEHIKAIRLHTRAWTHNPYRIDQAFCGLLKKYEVTVLGVHVIHPNELSVEFGEAVVRVRESGAKTMLLADIPLVKGINNNAEILGRLFMKLYLNGVKPYYLSHNMPNIPAAGLQRTSVRQGVELMNKLKRHISNPAMPEYIITHRSGKKTVPECPDGSADFIYTKDNNGWPIIKFKNWRGEWAEYQDASD